jgi:heavy metal translocating P-type ATPase
MTGTDANDRMTATALEIRVSNLDCEHDARAIQRGLDGFPGLVTLSVYPKAAKVSLTHAPGATTADAITRKLEALGFPPGEAAHAGPPSPWRNPKVLTSAGSGLLLLIGWLAAVAGAPAPASFTLYLVAILSGGWFFGREAVQDLLFERRVGIELLMSTAAVVSTFMGQAAEGAMLAFLYSISEAAEGYTEEKTRSAVRALMDLSPKRALVRREGREIELPVEEIGVADVFITRPGEAVATDGVVLAGASAVNQAPVTGESVPVEKQAGDTVFAGTLNGQGALEVRATRTFRDNTLARIVQMVEEAQERKGQSQRFIERFGARYSPLVLLAGFVVALLPPLLAGAAWSVWIARATVFVVAAAPCALVISIPITLVAALGTGARQGVLIKGGVYLEELAKVTVVALDKTGTLTRGEPEVTDVLAVSSGPFAGAADGLLAVAAGIERLSEHPLARAIVRHAQALGVLQVEVSEFQALTGAGATARVGGPPVFIGSPELFQSRLGVSHDPVATDLARLQEDGKTVALVGDKAGVWGLIALRDNVRPAAAHALQDLRAAGIRKIVMLTGDNPGTAHAIARELRVDEIHAGLSPEGKVAKVRELAAREGHVAMVGDGVNDAPALAEATVGIAMGAAGTDIALETADVALMGDDLEKIAYALRLAKRTQSVVRQNLALSALVIGVLVVGAIAGVFTLPVAVLGHELSEFVVIGSGLRMLRA